MSALRVDPVTVLSELIAIPSVNPMGQAAAGPEFGEACLTAHLEALLTRLGLRVWRQPVAPGQDNLLARLDGAPPPEQGGRQIVLCAHQDTVPVKGMTIEPFQPALRDGRIYGRGACDDKGGLAAMIAALVRLQESPAERRPTVTLACTVNEEHGFTGVQTLVNAWTAGGSAFFPRRPDAALVAEPTGLDVVVAHKGVARWQCRTRGRAAHSSRPELGDNAIYKMGRLLGCIERYQREALAVRPAHPLCGAATLSVGVIHGGVSVNTVPDECTIDIDRRLPPGETPEAARQHLIDYLAADDDAPHDVEFGPTTMSGLPLSERDNGPLAEQVSRAARAVLGAGRRIGVPYATDAAFIAAAGVPTVVCGPGFLEQAHTADEWVAAEQLHAAVEVYVGFLLGN